MTTWRLHVLGASSTLAPPGDATASLALSNDERVVVIDTGGDVPGQLERAGLDRGSVTDIIVTHSHPDHTYGLPFFSHSFYHDHLPVTCWSTAECIPRLRRSLEAYDLQDPDKYLDVEFRDVSTETVEPLPLLEDLELTAVPTDHSRPGFGLVLESDDQKILFSGDTTPCQPMVEEGHGADVLIHDCQGTHAYRRYFRESHTSARELGELATEMDVDLVVPFHYNLTELPSRWEEIGHEIREYYDGPITYPHKGMGFFL